MSLAPLTPLSQEQLVPTQIISQPEEDPVEALAQPILRESDFTPAETLSLADSERTISLILPLQDSQTSDQVVPETASSTAEN